MTDPNASTGEPVRPGRYEIRLQGYLDDRWSDWFDGLTLTREAEGVTLLAGPVVDQAALHGLLRKVRDLGLPLISVTQVDPAQAASPDDNQRIADDHSNEEKNP